MFDVCVIGLGYIGLPTSAVFASAGFKVHGVDVSESAVASINSGTSHIYEPGLADVVGRVVREGTFIAGLEPVVASSYIIAVPTPFMGDHEPDLTYVRQACRAIAPVLSPGAVIVLESTSPIGTTEMVAELLGELRPDLTIPTRGDARDPEALAIAYCPERVLPGQILHEMRTNDRILGGITPQCAERAAALYRMVVSGACSTTDCRTAELAKLSENAFRDVNIAFANELSVIADEHDVDARELISLANRHPRVNILSPGPGVGGHCIAVDPWFIVHSSPESARLVRTAREVNLAKTDWVLDRIASAMEDVNGSTVACLGLAYKPDIDDLRESPALAIAESLLATGTNLLVVEPNVAELPGSLIGAELVDLATALHNADLVVILVQHRQFAAGVEAIKSRAKSVIDTVGLLPERA